MKSLFRREKSALPGQPVPDEASSTTTFPVGIKSLHSPDLAAIDIVFVHGLTGNREQTWTTVGASKAWPESLLPPALPTARILTFGYDASVADFRSVVSTNRIGNHAWNLLTSLAAHRETDSTNERPIIFICHSLGGLVCEDALVKSKERREVHIQSILRQTRGIIFLGTPHHGAGLAKWAELISRSVSVIKQTNTNIVRTLKRDSEVLARVQDSFHTLLMTRREDGMEPIKITCFYEELPVAGIGLIVPHDSAILPGYIPIGIHGNHMEMTKFANADDPGFIALCAELRRWIKGIEQNQGHGVDLIAPNRTTELSGELEAGRGILDEPKSSNSNYSVLYTHNPDFDRRSEETKTGATSLRSNLETFHSYGIEEFNQTVAAESRANKEDITALRDAIVPLLLGQQSWLSDTDGNTLVTKLSSQDKADLTKELRSELLSHLSVLREACDFHREEAVIAVNKQKPKNRCHCHSQRSTKSVSLGFLSLRYETSVSHICTCEERLAPRFLRLRLAFQLLPFLEKTVELVFGGTFMGGGCHVDSPLRVFRTVKRSDSVVFQLFDVFVKRAGAKQKGSPWLTHMWNLKEEGVSFHRYDWSEGTARAELNLLYQQLIDMDGSGQGSIHDTDECGNTILHEVVFLIALLAPIYSGVIGEIDALLRLAERCYVDVDAIAVSKNRPHLLTELTSSQTWENPLQHWTAGQGAQIVVRVFHDQLGDFAFLRQISRFCSLDFDNSQHGKPFSKSDVSVPHLSRIECDSYPISIRSSLLVCLQREPYLATYFYEDELPLVILSRNMDALKRILLVSKLNNEYLGRLPLKVLDLAIGWPEGLKLLSTSWNPTGILSEAIELASFNSELGSLKVLCQYPAALFKNIPEMYTFMISLLRYGGVVVKELALRREKLAKIALDVFPTEDRTRFFLDDSGILDANAWTVYKTLQERDVPMPEALNPGPAGSIFGFVARAYTFPGMTLTGRNPILALYDLYDRGFRDIDLPEEISEETVPYTPLQRILNNGDFRKTNHWVGMCAWFLIMGGSPRFQGSASIKNALFGIANILGDYEEGVFLKYFNSKPIALLIRYTARLLPPLETDGCICFCSSNGCLPLHLVLRGPGFATTRHRCAQGQATRVWSWIKGCGIRSSAAKVCLEESVRLELFNRLGMRHTCCLAGRYMTDSDRAEIRMESEELQTQLELLMSAYRNSRDNEEQRWGDEFSSAGACYTICCECDEEDKEWPTYFFATDMAQSHRTGWLKRARAILPVDRALEAWCFRDSREDFYEQVEALCLKRLGYEGCNFVTIIRRHFREDLSMEESGNTGSESQRFVSSNNALLLRFAISWIFMEADEERDQNLIELTEMALEDLLDLEGSVERFFQDDD